MVELDKPLREKVALFWHLHIAIANKNFEFALHLLLDAYIKKWNRRQYCPVVIRRESIG
jgi:hypothetical protein